jgi:hypothetical protein
MMDVFQQPIPMEEFYPPWPRLHRACGHEPWKAQDQTPGDSPGLKGEAAMIDKSILRDKELWEGYGPEMERLVKVIEEIADKVFPDLESFSVEGKVPQ